MKVIFCNCNPFRLIPLCSMFAALAVALSAPTSARAQTDPPDVLFGVSVERSGMNVGGQAPATSWSYDTTGSCSSAAVTHTSSGSVSGNTLSSQVGCTINGLTSGCGPSDRHNISVYVRGTATSTITADGSGFATVSSNGTPRATASVSPPWDVANILAEKPYGPGGEDSASGAISNSKFGNIGCSGGDSEGCRTFPEYPGVLYCIPQRGNSAELNILASCDNDGPTQSTVNIAATGSVTITVERGADRPEAIISGPRVNGQLVTTVARGQTVTFRNDSYDPDNKEGSTALAGICDALWEAIGPIGTVIASDNDPSSFSFTPGVAGRYRVNMLTTDNEGDTQTNFAEFDVDPREDTGGDGTNESPDFGYFCPSLGSAGPSSGAPSGGVPDLGGGINAGTGNNRQKASDPISTRGYPLTNNIFINSQTKFPYLTSAMGNARFTYGIAVNILTVSAAAHYVLFDADGKELDFGPTSGAPVSPPRTFSQLNVLPIGYELLNAGPPESVNSAGNYRYEFLSDGKLYRITDPSGNVQEARYDTNGDLYEVEDLSSNRKIEFEYDTPGTIARIVEGGGAAVVHLSYDTGLLSQIRVADSLGNTIRDVAYTYTGRLLERIRRDGDPDTDIEFTYQFAGNVPLANFADKHGYASNIDYFTAPTTPGAKYRVSRTNAQGGIAYYDFDERYNLLQSGYDAASDAPTYTYTYGADRLVASVTDGATTTTYQYNTLGLPTQVAVSGGQTLNFTYNGTDLLTVADQDGTFLTLVYGDPQNPHHATSATDQGGNTWSVAYNAYGQITNFTPPPGSASGAMSTVYEEDDQSPDFGYPRSVTNGEGESVTYDSYSPLGDVLSQTTSPASGITNTTQYEYDPARRLTLVTNPDLTTQQWSYTGYLLDSVYDENASSTTYEWCKGCGKPKSVTSPLGKEIQWSYNSDRALAGFTDALSRGTTYTYGTAAHLTREDYPDGSYYTYQYDTYGRFLRRVDARGAFERVNVRDAAGRPTSIDYNTPWQTATTYTYYADSRLNQVGDEAGVTTYYYDSARRVQRVRTDFTRTGLTRIQEVEYTYYPDDLIQTMTWRDGTTVVATWTYTYDLAGRMTQVSNTFGQTINYTYDDEGKITSQTNNNGTSTEYGYYQPRGWVSSITHRRGLTPFETFAMTFDNGANTVGNITEVEELDASTVSYEYDDLYRLTSDVRTGTNPYTRSYAYDLAGNVTEVNGATFATYDAGNKFATVPGGSAGYDAIGNLTSISGTNFTTTSYTWNARSEMRSITRSGSTTTHRYNHNYQRSFRDVGVTADRVWYVYANRQLLGEVKTARVTAAYTWGPDGVAAERWLTNNISLFYHFGPQGETRYASDATGATVLSYVYTAYGQSMFASGTPYNSHRYGGKVGYFTEAAKGVILAWHRWYNPEAYRWLNRDPIGYDGGDNTYAYVGGNPVRWVDPSGLDVVNLGPEPVVVKGEKEKEFWLLPPRTSVPVSPDGVRTSDKRWSKVRGKDYLPDNDVCVSSGKAYCVGGSCLLFGGAYDYTSQAKKRPDWQVPSHVPVHPNTKSIDATSQSGGGAPQPQTLPAPRPW